MPRTTEAASLKERRFVDEYLVDGNATRSAIAAGYAQKQAAKTGSEMLRKPRIRVLLEAARLEQQQRTQITADRVFTDLYRIAEKAEKAGEFPAATRALELVGKHLGMFRDKVELTGKDGAPVAFERIVREIVSP